MFKKLTTTRLYGLSVTAARAPALAAAVALSVAGCASFAEKSPVPIVAPTQLDIANLKPSGKVSLTEVFIGGAGVGRGVLTFGGKPYPFRLVGTVIGPGSVSKRQVTGEVYKLNALSDFSGIWVEGTGPIGLETAGRSELWLENKAGVIMHLVGQSEGMTLSLGKDEVLIELNK